MRKFILILLMAVAAPRLVYAADAALPVTLLVGRSTIVDVGQANARTKHNYVVTDRRYTFVLRGQF